MARGSEFDTGEARGPDNLNRFPAWAEKERATDLAWIAENMHVFWPAAQAAYKESGQGAIVVDTTSHPTNEGHLFGYFPQEMIEQSDDEDVQRMVREYDPTRRSWWFSSKAGIGSAVIRCGSSHRNGEEIAPDKQ